MMPLSLQPQNFMPVLAEMLPGTEEGRLRLLAEYLALVDHYNRILNLTAFSGERELAGELVYEAARLFELGPIDSGWKVLDLGSGVGTPVVPLAILCPGASFAGIESRERRSVFLRQVKARLRLDNFEVLQLRVEELGLEHAMAYDLITARAFAQPADLLRLAMPLLKTSGELRGYLSGVQELDPQLLDQQGLMLTGSHEYSVPGGNGNRLVYCLRRSVRDL